MTESTLLRLLAVNDRSVQIGLVILDEAHERSASLDSLVAILCRGNSQIGQNAKVIISSATVDTTQFENFLPGSATVLLNQSRFPVEVETFLADPAFSTMKEVATKAFDTLHKSYIQHRNTTSVGKQLAKLIGNTLCFLAGSMDCEHAAEMFFNSVQGNSNWLHVVIPDVSASESIDEWRKELRKSLDLLNDDVVPVVLIPLYGQLPVQSQERALVSGNIEDSVVRIIFSTNIAETSVTIPAVAQVIDSGLQKTAVYNPERETTLLQLEVVSESSRKQRQGRAGRVRPGKCLSFVWPTPKLGGPIPHDDSKPEICRYDATH